MKDLSRILKTGSKLYRKYVAGKKKKQTQQTEQHLGYNQGSNFLSAFSDNNLLDIIRYNSVLSSLTALQKRYLESLAEGPRYFEANSYIWRVGQPVEFAYIIVSGTVSLGESNIPRGPFARMSRRGSTGAMSGSMPVENPSEQQRQFSPVSNLESDKLLQNVHPNSEYARLEVGLQSRVEEMEAAMMQVMEGSINTFGGSARYSREDSSRVNHDRFANKVLARLYSRRAYTKGMIFSRGNLLSDTSRMVSGDLASINRSIGDSVRTSISSAVGPVDHHCHTSNMVVGAQGCTAMIFPRATLVPFLDSNPGVLLTLLGTQVVV
jgi:hypothetical protein